MQESAVIEPQRSERLDGIDLLPESDRPVEETSFESKHLRSESTPLLSIPLPPLRTPTLELSINRISVELEASVCDAASSLDTPRPDSNREELNLGPSSPQLKEMMRQTSRSGKGRGSTDRDGGEDSDLGEYLQRRLAFAKYRRHQRTPPASRTEVTHPFAQLSSPETPSLTAPGV